MSVVIRLKMVGKRGTRIYQIVAVDKKRKRDSKPLEILGLTAREGKNDTVSLNKEKIAKWQAKGAQISPAVAKLL